MKKLYNRNNLIILGLFILLLLTSYQWRNNSCSYCFQGYLTENYIFQEKDINFESEYIDNTLNIVKHNSNNILGKFILKILNYNYLNFVFWGVISLLTLYLFFKKLFEINIVVLSLFVYLTNPTINVTIFTISYYFISMSFLYNLLVCKKNVYFVPFILTLLLSFNVDISPSFVILITSIFLVLFYISLNKINKDKSNKILYIYLLLILTFIGVVLYEKNFVSDLFGRLPLLLDKIIFYISSYPKGLYFYSYLLGKILLLIIPANYIYKILKNKFKIENLKERFIFSYFLTLFPLLILFILFDISARIFDYYSTLLAAISLREFGPFNKKKKKIILGLIVMFFVLFSIFLHYIPPRSLEKDNENLIAGLKVIPEDSIVYSDLFVANILITKLDHIKVVGPNFNKDKEYKKIYYEKDEGFIRNLFLDKEVEYFVISKESTTRGLDILNAPHFLKPITLQEYNNMSFLEKYYSNEGLNIWKINL